MKAVRYLAVLLSLSIVMMLQACGDSGNSDTFGSLTISTPSATDNKDGSYSVSATVTYAPPAGKTAQGVEVTTSATDSYGNIKSATHTFTSGSNSVTYTFYVLQSVGSSTGLSIVSNIGDMRSGVSVVIPAIVPMGAPSVQFKSTDAPGTVLTSAISGGIAPYVFVSVSTTDLSASVIGSTLNVTNTTTGINTANATVVVRDGSGSLLSIPVGYFIP
jgi:hypothetical protein